VLLGAGLRAPTESESAALGERVDRPLAPREPEGQEVVLELKSLAEKEKKRAGKRAAMKKVLGSLRPGKIVGRLRRKKDLEKDISDTNDEMKADAKANVEAMEKYAAEKADLSAAIDGIQNAMKTLKASKPSLLQLKSVSKTVREAMVMADALGLGVDTLQGPTAALLQQPDVEMENYKFHSDSVIETLEKLLGTFRDKKAKSDETEVKRLQDHDMKTQTNTDKVKAKTLELDNTQKSKADKTAEIAEDSQSLTTESAGLLDDQQYLQELYDNCKSKADTWDKRSQVRADEIMAITAATDIVKGTVREKTSSGTLRLAQRGITIRLAEAVAENEQAMEAVEAEAEEKEGSSSFLQRRSVSRHSPADGDAAVDRISQLLKSVGGKTKSALLTSLASEINTEKPKGMEKIKTLIEELIKRLQAEAASEATQKGWCDKSTSDAKTKRGSTAATIDELNDKLAGLEADRQLLTETLDKLADEIKELKDAQTEADNMRKDEKTENEATVSEAKEGKAAVESAIDILDKFYKEAAKAKVLLQVTSTEKITKQAPDAGFDNGEAYKGGQSDATGVLGMLDVILGDFDRTIKETDEAEARSDEDHKDFTERTQTSLKEKEELEKARKKEKSEADSKFDADSESLKKNTDLLKTTVEELLELKKACVDTGMSYEERVARREEEVAALNKALCILTAYSNYGPNAGMENC